MTQLQPAPVARLSELKGLSIGWDERVLEPREWTLAQSRWAAALLVGAPAGPVLELCSGVGYLGIDLARRTGRKVVQVDSDQAACQWAVENAVTAGVAELMDVRQEDVTKALHPGERFVAVLADPPYVPSAEVGRFPRDPTGAIDGGPDGLRVAQQVVAIAAEHLVPGGPLLLQLRGPAQAAAMIRWLLSEPEIGLAPGEVEVHSKDRAIALMHRRPVPDNGQAPSLSPVRR